MAERVTHTPGPWTFTNDRRGVWEIIHDGNMIAQVWLVKPGLDGDLPAEANARLIAAAPDLYSACDTIADLLEAAARLFEHGSRNAPTPDDFRSYAARLRRATAKAEGK